MAAGISRRPGVWIALASVTGLALLMAARADAFVYWGAQGFGGGPDAGIGRANLDGANPAPQFINTPTPCGIAVNSTHIYWASRGGNMIRRANLDGTGVVDIAPASQPCGVAVDDNFVYWANFNGGAGTTIGRANLDGAGPVQNYITGADDPCGVAVDSTYVYWANTSPGTIGRAPKANPAAADQNFITGGTNTCGVAVNATHIFWANAFVIDGIGRATLAGGDVNQTAYPADKPCGVAVDSTHVYWASRGTNTLARVGIDGSGLNSSLLPVAPNTCGIALDTAAKTFKIGIGKGKLRRNRKRGIAFLPVTVDGAGTVSLARGGGLRPASEQAAAPGTVELLLKPLKGTKGKLKQRGKAKVTATITFSPLGGVAVTESVKLSLQQKPKRG
jgi:hypothetical protein